MIKIAAIAAVAAATLATAAPVFAKDVSVQYGDLDLASDQGQRTFSQRVHRAARKACDFSNDGRLPSASAMRCYREARAKANVQMAARIDESRLGG